MNKYIIIGPIILLLIWWVVTSFNLVNPLFLSNPGETFIKFFQLIQTGKILPDLWATFYRTLISFGIAAFIGIPIGLILGSSKKVYSSLELVIDFFRSLPATALFPLFLLVFGIGDVAKIAIGIFVCVWIIIVNSAYGVLHSSKTRRKLAQTFKATKFQIFKEVTFFEALPQIFVGLRLSISIALIVVVVAEMFIGTKVGLGQRIFDAHLTYRTTELYAVILLAGLLGYVLNKLFLFTEKRVLHWAGK